MTFNSTFNSGGAPLSTTVLAVRGPFHTRVYECGRLCANHKVASYGSQPHLPHQSPTVPYVMVERCKGKTLNLCVG
jgi:hypothetical protein